MLIHQLGLSETALKMAGPFGGGMGIQDKCGALTGALMVIGALVNNPVQHQSPMVREITYAYMDLFKEEFKSLDCQTIKSAYLDPNDVGCGKVKLLAAQFLDQVIYSLNNS